MPEEITVTTATDAPQDESVTTTETVNVDGLKSALAKERQARADAEKTARDLSKWKADQEKVAADAATKKAQEDGDWQKLADSEKARADAAEAKATAAESAAWSLVVRANARAEAAAQGFTDPNDVLPFLDVAAVERDDAGEPKGLHALVKAIADKKPYLLKAAGGTGGPPATGRGNAATVTPEQEIQRAASELAGTGLYKRF